ncbi:RecQ family ATP-dependent DNA helicase [Desulfonema ishimotonii]|uniref:DNA 3'-5' helicase n=1 Tax=Desulfonema ishimotonii TaxID=45657 RepID=A0A401FWU8_9BACT|nr:RecQ family ATP-dependent DNA helicase [Desulfonema ishimotonii]GBC61436.1 RecQ family ATP-dependent DNA helicase [Desulfonema ishimotonii]
MRTVALNYLRTALNNPHANFRDGQWESIEGLLARKRMLVVQRTGWGKSMVYFLATKLMRRQGFGPTLLISPLLSLMRNQLEAASRIGVTAKTINSINNDKWDQIQGELIADKVDVLLISPERLANASFIHDVLSVIAEKIGLFVVDEAHCISDWGHDFRPDYRRIVRVLQAIPSNIPVLATTATANDRVIKDVMSQLGDDIDLFRGSLTRESLKLQNIYMPSPAARMAWLAQTIPNLPGSGIIYTLTQRDAERLSEWLRINGIDAKVYHAGIPSREDGTSVKEELEQQLLNNEVKVLVATVALGMGFDKPDLGFVIHFQRPASVVHYYQQVGRAGRAVDEAYGILLCGEEDDHIADFFIRNAFPPQTHITAILEALDRSDDGLSVPSLQSALNLKKSHIEKTIRFLTVESPSPITKVGSKWHVTPAAVNYKINQVYVDEITQIRRQEQSQMQEYMSHQGCLMAFLEKALDDPHPGKCGKCKNCNSERLLPEQYNDKIANRATRFLKRSYQKIKPRKQWPAHNPMPVYGFTGNIREELRASEGRALSLWRDAGWGQLVAEGKYKTRCFSGELVTACVDMILDWSPSPVPQWVTCIPSLNHPELVPDFAKRLAKALNLPFIPCIEKIRNNRQQKFMENSFQQAKNLDGVFNINPEPKAYSPCLLIDDMVDSRWTFTVAAALLRKAGCETVYPLALALNSPRMN